ncbi:MAG: DarT ssDNA thymidine ADP-ribosyltransferase family protein [Carnobacterium sp.]|uniref:DarT ssDNA thymidine ADP-ribosyltransferase family protein n=1 Tax=Carnobacterium sp. TaxID=48221 RepID=UPI0033163D20
MTNEVPLTFDYIADQLYEGNIFTGLHPMIRKSWTRYCYHFSHIDNIISILNIGKVYSRSKSKELELMQNDNASQDVINQTNILVKDYVRLYFRPKTPTQYHNEGLRNLRTTTNLNAHCPFPVFLLFDLKQVLTSENSFFCKHSLAHSSEYHLCNTPLELANFPFSKIYHDRSFSGAQRNEIISHRQAEIVVPNEMSLNTLKKIMVRSIAEKETLMYMLSDDSKKKYNELIQIDSKKIVFFGRWTFIEEVIGMSNRFIIKTNRGEQVTNYHIQVALIDNATSITYTYDNNTWPCVPEFEISFPTDIANYTLKILLNQNIVYWNNFNIDAKLDLPY